MEKPRITVVIPVHNAGETLAGSIQSALAQTDVSVHVVVVDDGSSDATGLVCLLFSFDPRVTVVTLEERHGSVGARAAGLAGTKTPWVCFLDADRRLERDACLMALRRAARDDAPLAVPASLLSPRTQRAPDPCSRLFDDPSWPLDLNGVVCDAELARRAFDRLPATKPCRAGSMLVLFALALEAGSLASFDAQPVTPLEETRPRPSTMDAAEFADLVTAAEALKGAGRVISRLDAWDEKRRTYRSLLLRLTRPLLERFPRNVEPKARTEAFDALCAAFPAAEAIDALGAWCADCLALVLDCAQGSAALRQRPCEPLKTLAVLLAPGEQPCQSVAAMELALANSSVRAVPLAQRGEHLVPPALELPRWEPGESYLPRARRLLAVLNEQDADAVACTLSCDAALPLDLLTARVSGRPVLVRVPLSLAWALGETGRVHDLVAVAQAATVLAAPREADAPFWRAATSGTVVACRESESSDSWLARLLDALEEGSARAVAPPAEGPLLPLFDPRLNDGSALGPRPCDADEVARLREQVSILQARLASAQSEATSLRRQLVALGCMPGAVDAPVVPDSPLGPEADD
ncbi:glycosyltransferase family 2 protein [Atopobiaceae bacterium 24-176]